ncbi:MAG: hypothetical protein K2O01_07160, partial [Bacteroidales bacterium]|nr:hypothetical protein [Bacteroidales bacterium]
GYKRQIVPVADTLPLVHTDTVTLADTVVAVDTVAVPLADTVVSADAVVSVTPVADTLPVATADTVLAVVSDTLVAEVDIAAIQPAAVSADTILPADTIVPVSDTVAVVSTDTVGPETPLYPEIVGKNFKKRFPNAEKVNWRQADGLYLVTFDQFGQVMSAAFREDGIQVYTAYAFSRKEMPLPIERYLQASAAKMKMTEGWRVVYESKYKRMFPSADRPKDYYYVVMGRKIPKRKEWQYIRYTFNQNAQFESKSDYVQPFEK